MELLDNFARQILRLLQIDSRRSAQELSENVGLSATPCWRRIKDMEQSGVIQRYTVLLDRESWACTCARWRMCNSRATPKAARNSSSGKSAPVRK